MRVEESEPSDLCPERVIHKINRRPRASHALDSRDACARVSVSVCGRPRVCAVIRCNDVPVQRFNVSPCGQLSNFQRSVSSMPEHTLTGNIQEHRGFKSKILGNRRDVLVYLPQGYRRFSRRQHPVLYLQDGQNVFDAATAFSHVEWGVDETAQRLIRQKLIDPLIIVAVANTGDERIHEYAPTRALIDVGAKRKKRSRGLARQYGRFLVEELKPFIDRKYRTRREPEFTGLGGSSLGGLVTLALGLWYPNVFSRLAVMSPSVWWDDQAIVRMVEELEEKTPLRIWLDT